MATHNPLRLGVIGAGWFASRRHCPDIVAHDDGTLTALCRRSRPELERMGQAFGVNALFTDHGDLLASGQVDGVVICSPHDLHYEHTRAALEAGLPVLLEKPLTIDPGQGRELVKLADARDLVLLVAQNPPYWSHCHRLQQIIAGDLIGSLEAVSISWVGNALGVLGREPLPDDMPGVVPPTLFRGDPQANGGFTQNLMGALWPEVYGLANLGGIRAITVSAMVLSTALGPGITGAFIDWGVGLPTQMLWMAGWCVVASLSLGYAARKVRVREADRRDLDVRV